MAGAGLDYRQETLHMERLPEPLRLQEAAAFATRLRVFHYATGREEVAPHGGPLTLKTVFAGAEAFLIEGRRITVRPGRTLLLPHGATYGSAVAEPTETFSASYPAPIRRELLAMPGHDPDAPPAEAALPPVPLRTGEETARALLAARAALAEGEEGQAEECLLLAARQVLLAMPELRAALARLGAARRAVREELLRRILRARDRIEDDLAHDAGLEELAATACLSRFHLLRSFRAAFGETPAAYRMRRRMEVARELLRRTDRPVGAIGRELGFASHAAFTRRVRLAFGMAPGALRGRAH